jgi:anaerobic ribonucleoside-triphosphate reductase activating protein
MQTLKLFGTADDSIVDGPGIRFAIFVQGCRHGCRGCHNPQAIPFEGGIPTTVDELWERIRANPLLSGITLSGGEPFEQPVPLIELVRRTRAAGLNVWAYSGYLYEELLAGEVGAAARGGSVDSGGAAAGDAAAGAADGYGAATDTTDDAAGSDTTATGAAARELLTLCDVLVDGRFVAAQASYALKWRGSANQRIIDVQASLQSGQVIEMEL